MHSPRLYLVLLLRAGLSPLRFLIWFQRGDEALSRQCHCRLYSFRFLLSSLLYTLLNIINSSYVFIVHAKWSGIASLALTYFRPRTVVRFSPACLFTSFQVVYSKGVHSSISTIHLPESGIFIHIVLTFQSYLYRFSRGPYCMLLLRFTLCDKIYIRPLLYKIMAVIASVFNLLNVKKVCCDIHNLIQCTNRCGLPLCSICFIFVVFLA